MRGSFATRYDMASGSQCQRLDTTPSPLPMPSDTNRRGWLYSSTGQSPDEVADQARWQTFARYFASGLFFDFSQFAVESMLALIHFQSILQDELCLLNGGSQFLVLIQIERS